MDAEKVEVGVVERDGQIIATGVSFEEYMARYAANFCEWVGEQVLTLAPISEDHDELTYYLRNLLEAFTDLRPIATIRSAPFSMKIDGKGREPDIQIILKNNPYYTPTGMIGPADICIEVVSPESIERDHGTKFAEYEAGGVTEYWIIDPLRNEARFYRLNEAKVYMRVEPDAEGNYQTPQLPDFKLHVPTLWEENLPSNVEVVDMVKTMVEG